MAYAKKKPMKKAPKKAAKGGDHMMPGMPPKGMKKMPMKKMGKGH